MKKVTIECEVEDFYPEDCTKINPLHRRNLYKALQRTAEIHREQDAILENAGGASPAPTKETEVLK